MRLNSLITNILRLNRLENQQISLKSEEFDLGGQLTECLLGFEAVWEEKGIEIEPDIEDDVRIASDRELLSIVWNNLLSNAFKFTEPGGTVSVALKADHDDAVVSVRDTGCGIPPETVRHIFDKFYQGDTSHSVQGNGLGLALVRRILDIVGGEIRVESTPGEGSTFIVRIPGAGFMQRDSFGQYTEVHKTVVIGAHYDSPISYSDRDTFPDYDGIQNNACGIGSLMTIAKQMVGKTYGYDVILVAFGASSSNYLGARSFLSSMKEPSMISLTVSVF